MTTHTIDTTNSAGCSPCTPEAHQKAGVEMTKDQWRKTHRDFKSVIDGQRYVLQWTANGTGLVPVTIII